MTTRNELPKNRFETFVKLFFLMMSFYILFSMLVLDNYLHYYTEKPEFTSNILLLIFGTLATAIFGIFIKKTKILQVVHVNNKCFSFMVAIIIFLVFIIQLFIVYNIFFQSGWDVGHLALATTNRLNGIPIGDSSYFKIYPNNLFLTFMFSVIAKGGEYLGLTMSASLILIGLVLVDTAGVILCFSVKEMTKNKKLSLGALIIYIFFICFSPWIVIPYSETYAILFPILIFYLYQIKYKFKHSSIIWFFITLLTGIGTMIKPTVSIVFIAIILHSIFKQTKSTIKVSYKNKHLYCSALFIVLAFFGATGLKQTACNYMGFTQDKEATFTAPHFFMMGQNDEKTGIFLNDDVLFSLGFDSAKERNAANIKVGLERISKRGFFGNIQFFTQKLLCNYSDGTFSWSGEGQFYEQTYPDVNDTTSPFLKSIFYSNGDNYHFFKDFEQTIWIMLLTSMIGIVFCKKSSTLTVGMLIIIGITAFTLLFEARTRYLYLYAPIYILLGVNGAYALVVTIKKKLKNSKFAF